MRKPGVIIFDDDEILLARLEFYFDKWGYEVFLHRSTLICLSNGSADSCKSLASCADLMIANFRLPQLTALELFQLQEHGGCKVERKMKAIILDSADEALLRQCKDSGYRLFQKPLYTSEIFSWVRECEKHFDLSKHLCGKKPKKRRDFRRNIEYCLNSPSPGEIFLGYTVNKSIDGLGLRVFNPLYAGQKITILKGLGGEKLNGTVVWCTKVGEHAYRAGLHFKGQQGNIK